MISSGVISFPLITLKSPAPACLDSSVSIPIPKIPQSSATKLDGPTAQVLDSGPLSAKFAAFGFDVQVVDGHDVEALAGVLSLHSERPLAVIAHTVKGKGLSFAENDVKWHDRCLDDDGYRRAVAELEAARKEVLANAE